MIHALSAALLGAATLDAPARDLLFGSTPGQTPPPSPPRELVCPTDWDAAVMELFKGGQYEVCAPEAFYYTHHPDVFGGYSGCVGESRLCPCDQDGFGGVSVSEEWKKKYVWNAETQTCDETGYTIEDTRFWILWGHPMDKYELNKRTGLNPVIKFPYVRGPYPRDDDHADLWPVHKDWLEYLGAHTREYLETFGAYPTEGAEQSMDLLYAGKALEFARKSCVRQFYVFVEAPGYGYDFGSAARWANTRSGDFYSGEECTCYPNCNEGTISFSQVGWFPGTEMPVREGGDGVMYMAGNSSTNSPWIETLVMPENPSGTIKVAQFEDVTRRVCDGVYMYPMYFGMTENVIPLDKVPECSGWAYSITKVYSAAFRAGVVSYKLDQPDFESALGRMSSLSRSGANGIYSDMSWKGYIQFMQLAMEKPVDDPTSWIGAYTDLQNEKWKLIIDAADGCPFMEITNPYAGAYSFWKAKEPAYGLTISEFFLDGFGVEATSYSWGFRGADPADFYGPGVGTMDFTRMQLYRDVGIYKEVARRIKIVCDGGTVPGWMSFDEWKASKSRRMRKLKAGGEALTRSEHLADIKAAAPHLSTSAAERLAEGRVLLEEREAKIASECAPEYATSCIMRITGARGDDVKLGELPKRKATYKERRSRRLAANKRLKEIKREKGQKRRQLDGHEEETLDTLMACAQKEAKGGASFEVCPAESFYWKHHPDVYGGYEGCVGESHLVPCAQDGFGGIEAMTDYKKPLVWNPDTEECEESGYTIEEGIFWILWGHPMDKYELNKRTGSDFTVTFPYLRGPYPTDDDSADMWPVHKDWLVYLGAHTREYVDQFEGFTTEGAEQSMDLLYAGKALELARTTCTRQIYVFTEAPGYGYDFAQAARWANTRASMFYSGEECLCFPNCNEPTISFSQVGWFPGTPIPAQIGGDNQTYIATSSSPNSPWIETLVMPENPSGTIKIPQLPVAKRVCDGVYMYPMYFGMTGNVIPLDRVPDCSGWAYSITKVYSAAFRAGAVSAKIDQELFTESLFMMVDLSQSGANGIYSDMSWLGYIQFMKFAMEKPVDDPTSWIGAYSELQNEKWKAIIDAADGCPFMEITNPYAGAYSFWKAKEPAYGLDIYEFFMEGFGVEATSYSWGFRGADPADFYGAGVSTMDFTRMQLYRDINIYLEVARRIEIVCDGGTVPGWMSFDEWKASKTSRRRRQLSSLDLEGHKADIKAAAPRLAEKDVHRIATARVLRQETNAIVERECAAENYASSCLMKYTQKPAFAT